MNPASLCRSNMEDFECLDGHAFNKVPFNANGVKRGLRFGFSVGMNQRQTEDANASIA